MEVKNPLFDDSTLYFQKFHKWTWTFRCFTLWMQHLCVWEVEFTILHTLHIHSCVQSDAFTWQDVERKVCGREREVRRHRAGLLFEAGLNLGPVSPVLQPHVLFYFDSLSSLIYLQSYHQPIRLNLKWLCKVVDIWNSTEYKDWCRYEWCFNQFIDWSLICGFIIEFSLQALI